MHWVALPGPTITEQETSGPFRGPELLVGQVKSSGELGKGRSSVAPPCSCSFFYPASQRGLGDWGASCA